MRKYPTSRFMMICLLTDSGLMMASMAMYGFLMKKVISGHMGAAAIG
jgi:hypothetical protein